MKTTFICQNTRLFDLSQRVDAPVLSRGELLCHGDKVFMIADIEHISFPDGGLDRMRLETRVYLRELGEAEIAARQEQRGAKGSSSIPLRY